MFSPMMNYARKACFSVTGAAVLAVSGMLAGMSQAMAEGPENWGLWHQAAASPNMYNIEWFDKYTLWFIVPITLLVTVLLAYVMIRFRASANPEPSKVTHNTAIEVIWTLGPVAILIAIAIPSFQLLTEQLTMPKEPALTIKATGYQWYWGYEYQGDNEISFESRPIGVDLIAGSEEAAEKERVEAGKTELKEYPRLLAVDNEIVVPVGEVIRVMVTAGDVIHDFALPAFGMKLDGYPGRMNETYFQASREGIFYGQCSELCGKLHAYMPIAIRVVSMDAYKAWADKAKEDVDAANKALMASIKSKKKTVEVAKR